MEIGFVTSTFVLTFALTQISLGMLLDTWGARRTQTIFYCIGGTGIIIFGLAPNVALLAIGRAILGIGMAGGLVAAVKAVSDSVGKEQIPFYNGVILAMGGVGALAATTPSKLFELEYGWRGLCVALGILTFLIALVIALADREKQPRTAAQPSLRDQIATLKSIYRDRLFWRIAPLFIFSLGGFVAMQGLWLGPWLEHVVGLSPLASANYLLAMTIAMIFGMLSGGPLSALSRRAKMPLTTVVTVGIAVHVAVQVVIVMGYFSSSYVIWLIYGYFAQITLINYAIISQHFGPQLSGRALTAVNLFTFSFAFVIQYLFGVILHLWPRSTGLGAPVIAYQVAFSIIIVLQFLALLWFVSQTREESPKQSV
jgi:MFS family permease